MPRVPALGAAASSRTKNPALGIILGGVLDGRLEARARAVWGLSRASVANLPRRQEKWCVLRYRRS